MHEEIEMESHRAESPSGSAPIQGRWIRFCSALVAIAPLSAFALARSLQPNSAGLGTHQQLGLPPCSMRLLLGIRCPGCGMTTSWAYFARGEWSASLQTSAGGFLFAVFALGVAFVALRTLFTATAPGERTQLWFAITAAGIFTVSLLQWLQRITLGD